MAYSYSDWFAQASSISGWTSGVVGNVQGIPVSTASSIYENMGPSGTGQGDITFADMSAAPGLNEGWWLWFHAMSFRADGVEITVSLSDDGFTTTLFTASTVTVIDDQTWVGIRITDSVMDGADWSTLSARFALTNLSASNGRLTVYAAYLSKSPYVEADKPILPSPLLGQDFHAYIMSDLETLFSAVATDDIPVIPDASGNGSHAFCVTGMGTYNATNDAVDAAADTRYTMSRDDEWTGNVLIHHRVKFDDVTTDDGPVTSRPGTGGANGGWVWQSSGTIDDKFVTGSQSSGTWVYMVGDGSPGSHLSGGSITTGTWYRTTWLTQQSDNDMMWIDDNTTADIDDASGANDFRGVSLFGRESDDRFFDGQCTELWIIEATGVTESDATDAADEWVNGIVTYDWALNGDWAENGDWQGIPDVSDDGALLSQFASMIGG